MFEDKYDRIIYFDTETTGLSYKTNCITELAYAVVEKNKPIQYFDDYIKINENQSYEAKAEEITGITREFLRLHGKNATEVMSKFHKAMFESPKTLMCAYNAAFDISFITNEFARANLHYNYQVDFLDPCTAYHDIAPSPHKLTNAIQFFKIENVQNSHNALDDVKALLAVTEKMQQKYSNLDKYINLMGYYGTFDQIECPWIMYVPFSIKNKIPLYDAYNYYVSSQNVARSINEATTERPICTTKTTSV